jgi:hypothetical protein
VTTQPDIDARDAEIAELRSRVAVLEHELAEQSRRTSRLLADAQEKLYWLERWGVDLDRVMKRPGAVPALEAARRLRGVFRLFKRLKRRLRGS